MHATWHVATGVLSKNADIDHCGFEIRTAICVRDTCRERERGRKEDREISAHVYACQCMYIYVYIYIYVYVHLLI